MIAKKDISDALALSCVESYFLAWLKQYYDVLNLYGESFISLKQVFNDFSHGAMYQNYCYLPRLQDIAEDYGIVIHEYVSCSGQEAIDRIKNQSKDELCLIRVNTSFFTNFKRSSWREDHYICVERNLNWLNQYPLSEGNFDEKRFLEVYDGALCFYRLDDLSVILPDKASEQYIKQDFDISEIPSNLGDLESAIGVLRVSRKRLKEYYKNNISINELLRQEIVLMDKIYFDVHLRSLKQMRKESIDRENAFAELYEKIVQILNLEKQIGESLRQ